VDKVAFTGSPATGRKVMAACAERLTPVLLELGGKDAMVVDADADLDAAATQALWGGMANAGQTCLATERVYVVDQVYDRFLERLVERASRVRPGGDPGADLGPITLPRQLETIRRHLDDAFARGARALVGGPDAVRPPYVDPVVLVDVPADALILREETFGPVLPIWRVGGLDEAIERANDSAFGLGSAIWTRDLHRANLAAERLEAGYTWVNATNKVYDELPFGGLKQSGYGKEHGIEALDYYQETKSLVVRH
jgi:acyl-CoA reductase-like NAD-dependent aldehyde dehydrogenase